MMPGGAVPKPITAPLPEGVRAAQLVGLDYNNNALEVLVVWSDRATDACLECGREWPVAVPECPIGVYFVDPSGWQFVESPYQCGGCGRNAYVDWRHTTPQRLLKDAEELARERQRKIDADRERVRARLSEDLRAALRRLAEPLADGESREDREREVTTGTEVEPGVYRALETDLWTAWDYYGLRGPEDIVAVDETDLDAEDSARDEGN